MQKFSKNWKQGAQKRRIDGKLVGKGAATGLKKGGHDRGTSPYPFPMWVAPPGTRLSNFYILFHITDGVEGTHDSHPLAGG